MDFPQSDELWNTSLARAVGLVLVAIAAGLHTLSRAGRLLVKMDEASPDEHGLRQDGEDAH